MKCSDITMQHTRWLESIHTTTWERTEFEDELPPSVEALWRHWLRTCWVSHYWGQATQNCYTFLDVAKNGWNLNADGEIEVDCDAPENIAKVRDRVQLLLRGCSCKKGCTTKRCSCLKAGKHCGPGCSCCNCENIVNTPPRVGLEVEVETSVEDDELEDDEVLRQEYFNEIVDGDEEIVIDSDDETVDEDDYDLCEDDCF